MSDSCVVLLQLVKLALLEEDHSVPELLLNFPVLLLERRELAPSKRRDVNGSGVVIRVVRRVAVCVENSGEPRIALVGFRGMCLLLLRWAR